MGKVSGRMEEISPLPNLTKASVT